MARPMTLISKDTLVLMFEEHSLGVPYSVLARRHNLKMTTPTLSKLLGHYHSYLDSDGALQEKVYNSLFPCWLKEVEQIQPTSWVYRGVMPVGRWEYR